MSSVAQDLLLTGIRNNSNDWRKRLGQLRQQPSSWARTADLQQAIELLVAGDHEKRVLAIEVQRQLIKENATSMPTEAAIQLRQRLIELLAATGYRKVARLELQWLETVAAASENARVSAKAIKTVVALYERFTWLAD